MITHAVDKAYIKFKERNHDTFYLCVDIHDTIAESNYTGVSYNFYPEAIEALRFLSSLKEMRIILFSSCFEVEHEPYIQALEAQGIKIAYFNENPEVPNTRTGCFDKKFYFDVLVDDKAGFIRSDWKLLVDHVILLRKTYVKAA